MHESAREAGADDIERIVELGVLLRAELAVERGGELWQTADASLLGTDEVRAWLDDPGARVVVGTIDDVILGYCVVRAVALRDGTRLGVIDELFVERDAREVGVGEELIDDVTAWCTELGCRGIDATALPGQRATKNFFEGGGFVTRRLTMHRSLRQAGG
jgi:GNAT superfamily N-acetyltransferase